MTTAWLSFTDKCCEPAPLTRPQCGCSVSAEFPRTPCAGQETPVTVASARERLLLKLADAIERHAQTLGEIETIDNGKAIGPCIEMDILGDAELLRYMAGFATKLHGATRQVSIPGEHLAWTFREPVGVVGAIVPWN